MSRHLYPIPNPHQRRRPRPIQPLRKRQTLGQFRSHHLPCRTSPLRPQRPANHPDLPCSLNRRGRLLTSSRAGQAHKSRITATAASSATGRETAGTKAGPAAPG